MRFIQVGLTVLFLTSSTAFAVDEVRDDNLSNSLKIDANHNIKRLSAFRDEAVGNKILNDEREKGLAEYLEDQEKWDLLRERGLRDYQLQKKSKSRDQKSAEYLEYLEQKESENAIIERYRSNHVIVRDQVLNQIKSNIGNLELEELGLINQRPRYDFRQRTNNKWVSRGSFGGSVNTGASSPGFYQPPAVGNTDFAPAVDFSTTPAPYENFDEIQPPQLPPPVYDSSTTPFFDNSGGGGDFNIPPPPPPPDFDF